jgi:hypothetical protein
MAYLHTVLVRERLEHLNMHPQWTSCYACEVRTRPLLATIVQS